MDKSYKNQEDGWLRFIDLCQKVRGTDQWHEFLDLFTTPAEREALSVRYMIVQELLKGEMTQREITKAANTSVAKITRGSNYLKGISPELREFLQNYFK